MAREIYNQDRLSSEWTQGPEAWRAVPSLGVEGVVGFDGFIDIFIQMSNPDTMEQFGAAVKDSAGISTSFKVHRQGERFGGNGPLLACALQELSQKQGQLHYIGALGKEGILPIFEEAMGERMASLTSVADPAYSECLEFKDGKVMLSDMAACDDITWEGILQTCGTEVMAERLRKAEVIAAVNWGKVTHATQIWKGLAAMLKQDRAQPKSKTLFVDLAEFDPRSQEDKAELPNLFKEVTEVFSTMLSLNLKEAWQLADIYGLEINRSKDPDDVLDVSEKLQQASGIDTLIIHLNNAASIATESDSVFTVGPFCPSPLTSVGAGDHFGAGALMAKWLGLAPLDILMMGNGVSGYFVRTGQSPSLEQIVEMLKTWLDHGQLPDRF